MKCKTQVVYNYELNFFVEFTNATDYDPRTGCPKNLLIPPYGEAALPTTTPPPPPTGAPGVIGPPGPIVSTAVFLELQYLALVICISFIMFILSQGSRVLVMSHMND